MKGIRISGVFFLAGFVCFFFNSYKQSYAKPGSPFINRPFSDSTFNGASPVKVKPKKIKRRRSVYRLQSQSVARALNLSQVQMDSLEVLYRETRKNRKLELSKYPDKQDRAKYNPIAREINDREREKLLISMKEILSVDQAEEAIIPLGSFNPRWDNYVGTLQYLDIERGKKEAAMQFILLYAIEYAQESKNGKGSKSSKGSRGQSSGKQKLDYNLSNLLTTAQFDEWLQMTNKSNKKDKNQ